MVVFYYILWTLSLALKLSILRWAEMIFYGPKNWSWSEILQTVITGFRFDLMIVGFWLAPIVIYLILSEILPRSAALLKPGLAKIYLHISWAFICFLYLKDLISFPVIQGRLWWPDHLAHPFFNSQHASQIDWWVWVGIIFLIFGVYQAGALRFSNFVHRFQKVGFFSLAFIFLWSAFICRGTLSQHHLRRKDCQFSLNSKIESLCLNPIFTFSKHK
jgi:hypothetical protein